MQVKGGSVFFELGEVRKLLPEKLVLHGYTLLEIIGKNSSLSFKVNGNDQITFVTTENDIQVKVTPSKFYSHDTLSSLVAECEQILKSATENGAFQELEMAVTVALQLQSYFERIAQRVVQRSTSDLWAAIKSLQSQLTQKQ
jgi:ABC-type uncharacterized transport system substrate-binding protein